MNAKIRRTERKPLACYVLSAERPEYTVAGNAGRTASLRAALSRHGIQYREATGEWEGNREASTVLYTAGGAATRALVLQLMAQYGQEAVLYVSPGRVAYLISGPGFSRKRLGYFVASSYSDAFDLPGHTYVPALATYFGIVTAKPARALGTNLEAK